MNGPISNVELRDAIKWGEQHAAKLQRGGFVVEHSFEVIVEAARRYLQRMSQTGRSDAP